MRQGTWLVEPQCAKGPLRRHSTGAATTPDRLYIGIAAGMSIARVWARRYPRNGNADIEPIYGPRLPYCAKEPLRRHSTGDHCKVLKKSARTNEGRAGI